MKLLLALLFLSLTTLAGNPTLIKRTSAGEDLTKNPEIQKRTPLFIYYVADVRPTFRSRFTEHLQNILTALVAPESEYTAEERSYLLRIRDYILTDLEVPRSSADREIVELISEVCKSNGKLKSDAVIFQNSSHPSLTVNHGWDVLSSYDTCRSDIPGDSISKKLWEVNNLGPLLRNPLWEDQFLSHPLVFQKALEEVQKVFPADRYRYILMIRSQGDTEHVFKAQYAFDTSALDARKLRSLFIQQVQKMGGWNFIMDTNLSTLIQETIGTLLPPLSTGTQGMTKWQFLEHIGDLGGGDPLQGAFFSQVILNTFNGPLETATELKGLITADDYSGLNLQNIGGIRHFGETGSEFPAPFDQLGDFFGPLPTFEQRWNSILDRLAKNGGTL